MVKRNTMIGNFEMGVLNMIDIENYLTLLRATWVGRLSVEEWTIGN